MTLSYLYLRYVVCLEIAFLEKASFAAHWPINRINLFQVTYYKSEKVLFVEIIEGNYILTR